MASSRHGVAPSSSLHELEGAVKRVSKTGKPELDFAEFKEYINSQLLVGSVQGCVRAGGALSQQAVPVDAAFARLHPHLAEASEAGDEWHTRPPTSPPLEK